jgi:NDP-sugar pyrophosphorylase family protein
MKGYIPMAQAPLGMILAAGFGKRLLSLSNLRPKPMMEVASKPIIYHLIKMLEDAGVKDIVINLHHRADQAAKTLSSFKFKARIHTIYESKILDTAGGIAKAIKIFNIKNSEMIVLHGDIFCDIDLKRFLNKKNFCTLICDHDRLVEGYEKNVGIDKNGNILKLGRYYEIDQPVTKRGFFTGIHFLSKEALELIRECGQQSLVADIYPQWLKSGHLIKAIIMPLKFEDLGSPERIFLQNLKILKNPHEYRHINFFHGLKPTSFAPHVFIGEGVSIDKSAVIKGPAIIADKAYIGKNAKIGPYAIIGGSVRVNSNAAIKNSVIMSKTMVEKGEQIDCMIALNSVRVKVKLSSI